MRPYLRLRPYMAGSVMPQKAETVAGPAMLLIRAFLILIHTARAPPPWAIMVAETMAFRYEFPVEASSEEMSGMTAQCRPKMTRHW